jgi:hypothetical protein
MFFKHTTDGGTPRSTMSWNITSTAPAGTYPTQTVSGGTTMAGNSLVAGTSGSFMMPLTVCNYNSFTNTQYLFQEQAQFSGSTIGGAVSSSTIDTTNTFYINLLATNTSGNADVFDFNGGEWRLE